jgi:putative ABC transport system substrate-binding protein
VEGKNIIIEYRYASGQSERYAGFMQEFVKLRVDVIVAGGGTPAATAAQRATSSIPIVVPLMADPIGSGLVRSLARPGGQLSGISLMMSETSGKRVEILREAFPTLKYVAVLLDPTTDYGQISATQAAAVSHGFSLKVVRARSAEELEMAFDQAAKSGAQAMIVLTSSMLNANRRRIVQLVERNRMVGIYENRLYVEAGGLLSYGTDVADLYRVSAKYVDRILRGARVGELPIEQPTKFELLVNLRTARLLGIELPRSLLLRADQIVE